MSPLYRFSFTRRLDPGRPPHCNRGQRGQSDFKLDENDPVGVPCRDHEGRRPGLASSRKNAKVVLELIGKKYLTEQNGHGRQRHEAPGDWVRRGQISRASGDTCVCRV